MKFTLMNRLLANGFMEDVDHHESDLYVPVTPKSTAIIDEWLKDNGFKKDVFVSVFTDNITGKKMYDVAFQYDPFWDKTSPNKKNTKVYYIYRDGANYKLLCSAILSGMISDDTWEKLEKTVDLDCFYPAKLGLPADTFVTRGCRAYSDDPDNHEIIDWELTDEAPNVECTAQEFVHGLLNGVCTLRKDYVYGNQ